MSIVQQQRIAGQTASCILRPQEGYDLASPWYDTWHWTEFWKRNELPITTTMLGRIPSGSALDAGSGTGVYRFQLEGMGHKTTAIDISSKMLDIQARKEGLPGHYANAALIHGDIRHMPMDWNKAFNCIVCARVLSHIEDYRLAIKELNRVLKDNGRVIITDVDPCHPYSCVTIKNGSIHSRIGIFKHTHHELADAFFAHGLCVHSFKRYYLDDLMWPPTADRFSQIYGTPKAAIFYIYELVKM